MKAVIVDQYKKHGPVRIGEMPMPQLRPNDVLIKVSAASLNPLDAKVRDGEFKMLLPFKTPFVLGNDVAGVVTQVGTAVRDIAVGDAVFAKIEPGRIGTLAEYVAIDAAVVAPKPASLSMEDAASFPLVGLTAWQALVETAALKPGQKVLIHAGSGGVGTIAIQLAKHLGAYVAATTSTANVELVRSLGADLVIDYKQQDFQTLVRDYDVVLHNLDTPTLLKSLQLLKPGGVLISLTGPPTPAFAQQLGLAFPLRLVMRLLSRKVRAQARQRQVSYTFLFMRGDGPQLRTLAGLLDSGVLRPVIDTVYPLARAQEALAHVDSGRVKGKVVVTL
ncbi:MULTISPECIES: NADP-dependent oxidoreductase [Xanthomonas]|uniref:NADP-dependent oxidoreductase n=1 Tax=Xanthomonas dyei TaxID=743699 RepID=A0ABZ0DAF4_9XANT|nr:NADP-dependent oxidoreductase [Xanthomonas dyei]MCC4632004.1 NADP-dependent oxidoreductase [Xanthomonas dyei pv. eucalypti]WOB26787.1 NADP-dependent oxidoreductase [Xanthomonas dyei]WOB54406.1 NADP-dependent oxidoreductase [Xanthomonas dyei]